MANAYWQYTVSRIGISDLAGQHEHFVVISGAHIERDCLDTGLATNLSNRTPSKKILLMSTEVHSSTLPAPVQVSPTHLRGVATDRRLDDLTSKGSAFDLLFSKRPIRLSLYGKWQINLLPCSLQLIAAKRECGLPTNSPHLVAMRDDLTSPTNHC